MSAESSSLHAAPLTFETTTSQHNIRRDEIVQQPISLANLETLDGARVIGEQLDGFCLIQYITVLVASDVIEEIGDDCLAATFRENKVLSRLELQQHVRFIMVYELDSVFLEILHSDRCFTRKLVAVLLVGQAFADQSHLLDPVFVEVQILVQAEVGHSPLGSAASFTFPANFDEGYFALLAILGTFFEEAQRGHAASETAADDDKIIVCGGSHVDIRIVPLRGPKKCQVRWYLFGVY